VDSDATAIRAIMANLARTHLADRARVVTAEAIAWLRRPEATEAGPFGLVFVDPPYARPDLVVAALEALGPNLDPAARVVAKHFWRDQPPARVGLLASERGRRFGETALTFYRLEDR
jgi:16S rRNA G966 N2-methylase RsmD